MPTTSTGTPPGYDNSKRPRGDAALLASVRRDLTWSLARDLLLSLACFLIGVHGPKRVALPLLGGVTARPIPHQATAAGDVLLDLTLAHDMIPKVDATFPSHKLWFISLWMPIATVVFLGALFPLTLATVPSNSPVHNMHAGTCTVLVALGLSELVTQTAKFYVGRLRPNFYAMCGFDADTLACTNWEAMETEARMSFPSGHSSLSFCGLVCLALFFRGRVHSNLASGRGKILTLASFAPLLLSGWCATSRLVDNWHHPSDIIAGSIVGTCAACISYHLWFPRLDSVYAGIPLSVIWNIEDTDYQVVEKSLGLPSFR